MMIIKAMQTFLVTERIIEVHCTPARYRKAIGNAVLYQKISHIIGKTYFHIAYLPCIFRAVSAQTRRKKLLEKSFLRTLSRTFDRLARSFGCARFSCRGLPHSRFFFAERRRKEKAKQKETPFFQEKTF